MIFLNKIIKCVEYVIELIRKTKWWQDIEKYNEQMDILLYEKDDAVGCLKIFGKVLFKLIIVIIPLVLVLYGFYFIFTRYIIPCLIILTVGFYTIMSKFKAQETTTGMFFSDDVWQTLAVRVIKPVTQEPVDVMDLEGRFDGMLNAYVFTLIKEVSSEIEIESMRQKINRRLAQWSGVGIDEIRKNKIVDFNGKTVKIRIF